MFALHRRSPARQRPPAVACFGIALAILLAAAPRTHAVAAHSTAIDVTPDGSEVWVVNPDHGTVGVIAATGAQENQLIAEVPVGAEPWCLDIHPSSGEVWVTSMRENKIYVIDGPSRTVTTTIDNLGFDLFGVSFNPAGTVALATASGSDEIFEIDSATRAITRRVPAYRRPRGIAWRPDGARAWVSHLLMPEFFGRLSTYFVSTGSVTQILISQNFGATLAGYPTCVQNITLAPPPFDIQLWLPNNMINTSAGQISGNPLTPSNIMHAVVSPVNINSNQHIPTNTYFMTVSGTPASGPIAVDFNAAGTRGFVANLNSDNVTVLGPDIIHESEVGAVAVGKAPIGIVTHPTLDRAYVANWLSRDVTVIDTGTMGVVTTVASTSEPEPLPASVLNGKRLFFSSAPPLAVNQTGACASCHVFGTMDGRRWDLSQFGKHLRGTPDVRGIGFTGAHDWTADKDEMADHDFAFIQFTGGTGLIASPNPPLGAPNAGLSQDMDDIGRFMATLTPRTRTPFQNPDGSLTADADSGRTIFFDSNVHCAECHIPPFYTDSHLGQPFIKHDVGTADSTDADGTAGYDTPTLCGVWDTGQYLHTNFDNTTLRDVLTTFNPNDRHGSTSQLTSHEIDLLVAFLKEIAWPESTGTAVGAPLTSPQRAHADLQSVYPNPFDATTSFRFSVGADASVARIDVYDVGGRHVRSLIERRLPRGAHTVGWDGRDDAGKRVPAGTYFARLFLDGQRSGEKKLTLLR